MVLNWVKRHPLLVFVVVAVATTVGVCAAAAHSAYLDFVAQDVTPDMDAEMRGRMEFHAWETAHFGFWLMLIGAFPYLAGVLLVGGLVIVSLRPKS